VDPDSAAARHKAPPVPPGLLRDPGHCLSLGFGTGLAPYAPGTFGTLAGVVLYLGLARLPLAGYVLVVALAFGAGIGLCGRTALALGVKDHPGIVWDEIVGYWVTMLAVPLGWGWCAAGFVLFRLFDIVKPWPIRVLDRRIGGGLGIMLDDLAAGVFALSLLNLWAYISE
jgi:phosphatidylglycerophosphatase A